MNDAFENNIAYIRRQFDAHDPRNPENWDEPELDEETSIYINVYESLSEPNVLFVVAIPYDDEQDWQEEDMYSSKDLEMLIDLSFATYYDGVSIADYEDDYHFDKHFYQPKDRVRIYSGNHWSSKAEIFPNKPQTKIGQEFIQRLKAEHFD